MASKLSSRIIRATRLRFSDDVPERSVESMTALRSLPPPAPVVATTGRNFCDSPLPTDTCARCPACLAMASVLGCVRRCLLAKAAAPLASSLYFLQGTLQKIHLHRLLGEQAFELKNFLSVGRCTCTRPRCFFTWFSRLKLSAPLVQASSGYPSSLANSSTLSQVPMRSTAMRWNFREYRFRRSIRVSSPGECAHRECANSREHSTLSMYGGALRFSSHSRSGRFFRHADFDVKER